MEKEKLKVLHIGLWNNPGGIENCILNYALNMDKDRLTFDIADINGQGIMYSEIFEDLGGKIYSMPNIKRRPLYVTKELKRIIRENNYKLVHIHMLSAANILPVTAALKAGNARVIVHSHNTILPKGALRKAFHKINVGALRRKPVEKWACGRAAGEWLWGSEFDVKNVMPNAIDLDAFRRDPEKGRAFREEYGIDKDAFLLLYVGRLVEQKNPLFLAEIMRSCYEKDKESRLLIVGDGPYRGALEKKLMDYGLRDKVTFTGKLKSARDAYMAGDAFVLPSNFEGLPVVGVEAQAAGLWCYMSDRVSEEASVTVNVEFLPLDKGESWAERILSKKNVPAKTDTFNMSYEIGEAAKRLDEKYRGLLDKASS